MAYNYTYGTATYNGITLRYIKTTPDRISPTYINPPKTMSNTGYYGINGGFFNSNYSLLSIAAVNGNAIGGGSNNGQYYVNNKPIKIYRGTLVWDGETKKLSVKIVYTITELNLSGDSWAQGGVSMCLQNSEDFFLETVKGERLPEYDSKDTRSGIVYDKSCSNVWLIITTDKCTASDFRAAIKNKIGGGSLADGIFLDGGSSTSMRCSTFYKDGNFLPEIIRLKDM